jgi:hypothetical protein
VTERGCLTVVTVTHARIRVGQGDVEGARQVLNEVLRRDPDHPEAAALLETLRDALSRRVAEAPEAPLPPPAAATAHELAVRFRTALGPGRTRPAAGAVVRLEDWLQRVRESRCREPR